MFRATLVHLMEKPRPDTCVFLPRPKTHPALELFIWIRWFGFVPHVCVRLGEAGPRQPCCDTDDIDLHPKTNNPTSPRVVPQVVPQAAVLCSVTYRRNIKARYLHCTAHDHGHAVVPPHCANCYKCTCHTIFDASSNWLLGGSQWTSSHLRRYKSYLQPDSLIPIYSTVPTTFGNTLNLLINHSSWMSTCNSSLSSLRLEFVSFQHRHRHAVLHLSSCSCVRCRGKSQGPTGFLAISHILHRTLMQGRGQADDALLKPQITSAPAIEARDLVSDINQFTSGLSTLLESAEASLMSQYSSQFANLTASASSATSSLASQLSTADAAASASIQSQLSLVAANVSIASAALQAAESAVNNSTSTSSSATSSTTGNVGCAPTAAVGMGALAGGIAVLMQL